MVLVAATCPCRSAYAGPSDHHPVRGNPVSCKRRGIPHKPFCQQCETAALRLRPRPRAAAPAAPTSTPSRMPDRLRSRPVQAHHRGRLFPAWPPLRWFSTSRCWSNRGSFCRQDVNGVILKTRHTGPSKTCESESLIGPGGWWGSSKSSLMPRPTLCRLPSWPFHRSCSRSRLPGAFTWTVLAVDDAGHR